MFHYKIQEPAGDILCPLPLMTVLTKDKNSMCDILDAIEKRGYDMGFDEGKELKARKDTIGMYRKGLDPTDIVEITGTCTETVLEWLDEA